MNNIQKATALIQTFTNGDTATAADLLHPDYIQHNLAYPTGCEGFLAAVEGLAQAPVQTSVQTIRAFEDGDKVFLHNQYNFAGAGDQVAFDIFRFDPEGRIVEHWDNLLDVKAPNPSGHSQVDGETSARAVDKEATRQLVANFIADVLQGQAPEKITSYIDGENYIQHNPNIADGLSGLGAALSAMAEQGIEMIYDRTHFVLADGNFALAVSEGSFAGQATAYYDLFRVEDGKIVEHWDVMETIASEAAHDNGKF